MAPTPVRVHAWLLLLLAAPMLTGCELAGDIFKLGVWAGVILIGLLALAGYAAVRFMRR